MDLSSSGDFYKAIQKGNWADYLSLIKADARLANVTKHLPARVRIDERVLQTTPLHKAVGEFKFYGTHDRRRPNHHRITRDLLERGADRSLRGSQLHVNAYCSAAMAGNNHTAEVLTPSTWTRFESAVAGRYEDLESLSAEEVEVADINGMTSLHYCAASRLGLEDSRRAESLSRTAQVLVDRGARMDRCWPGCFGSTESHLLPTSFAAMGNPAVLEVLLARGAPVVEPASPGANGNATAHATWSRCAPCLNMLIAHGAGQRPSVETEGYNPYHWIARTGFPDESEALIRFIASKRFVNISARTAAGLTPQEVARTFGNNALVAIFDSL